MQADIPLHNFSKLLLPAIGPTEPWEEASRQIQEDYET